MKLRVLHGLDLKIESGEFVAISGKSGSGKSTLLYILSTLDTPSDGEVIIDGKKLQEMSVSELHEFRNRYVGFVFQFHYLLSEINVIENILLPARQAGEYEERKERAISILKRLDIHDKVTSMPGELSGGQQQRVAIARALIMNPKYIFADEPTGNLDTQNAGVVMDILKEVNKDEGTTIALVTHDTDYSAMAQREIFLVDGKIVSNR
jgi:putative ABC transport system ATP-binding protein/lipoprotein-releasing system ATP-binding protein